MCPRIIGSPASGYVTGFSPRGFAIYFVGSSPGLALKPSL